MKLIEKKCPNCGANLEFSEKDKSCKCEYCHRAFEIERDENNENEYNLNVVETSKTTAFVISIITIVMFVAATAFILSIFSDFRSKDKVSYFTNVSELSNDDFEDIDHDAAMFIKAVAEGPNSNDHSYTKEREQVRPKIYVASKKDGNVIISVYEVKYYDFFHQKVDILFMFL